MRHQAGLTGGLLLELDLMNATHRFIWVHNYFILLVKYVQLNKGHYFTGSKSAGSESRSEQTLDD